ncbi:unnamed protein product, partial [Allacma fusca]
ICSIFLTSFVPVGLVNGLGLQLVTALKNFSDNFEIQIYKYNVFERNDKSVIIELAKSALQLKKCYRMYAKIFGPISTAIILLGGCAFGYSVYSAIWPKDGVTGLPYLLENILLNISVINIGNVLNNEVKKTKRKMERGLAFLKLESSNLELQLVTEMMATWRWEFPCCHLFIIDNKIYPVLAMAVISCMTFIIQLEISESSKSLQCP